MGRHSDSATWDQAAMVRRSWRHVALGIALLALIVVIGTIGYVVFGFGVLDATYQTVTTITTVGIPRGRAARLGRQGVHDRADPGGCRHRARTR